MRPPFSTHDEISSTAKLLDVIRGEGFSSPGQSEISTFPPASTGQVVQEFLQSLPFFRKHIVVGIEVGPRYLTLVKMVRLSPSRQKLLDYRLVPFEPSTPAGGPGFYEFLRSVVIEFCGSLKRVNLWSIVPTDQVELRQIRIPQKVAKKALYNAIFWVAKKEMNFDEKESLFDFEIQGKVVEENIGKIWVMAYTVPKDAVKEMNAIFAKSGLELAGLTIAPFAAQNLFRTQWVSTSGVSAYAALQFGDSSSRLSIFTQGNLILTKEIDTGMDSLRANLLEEESTFEEVGPALEKLLRQVEEVFEYHSEHGKGKPIERLFISGPLNPGKAILNYISESLGIRTATVDLLNPANPFVSRVRPPLSVAERSRYASALSLALSDNSHTPNLLCTFEEKERRAAVARLNRSIFWIFMSVFLILGAVFLWQEQIRSRKTAELSQLRQELAQYTPLVDHDTVTRMVSRVKEEQRLLKGKAEKVLGVAVLSELSARTPEPIRLIGITAALGGIPPAPATEIGPGQIKGISKSLVIDGIIQADSLTAEATLAHYLIKLGSSPMFLDPSIHVSARETYPGVGEVLHFIIRMGLVQGV
jgi:Tfp pilus assembly PilM family ATPase